MSAESPTPQVPHRRRPRYSGKNPRRFDHKYKELNPDPDTIAKVRASGKTPAGQHVPILIAEILKILAPKPGDLAIDATLGYGGHAAELLSAIQPGGTLLAIDQDPVEIVRSEQRLRSLGFGDAALEVKRTNFAGISRAIASIGWTEGADMILADLGLSSMQIDNPERGFSFKHDGPLDMRMNPERGVTARVLLHKLDPSKLEALLLENADEPRAALIAAVIAGQDHPTTRSLADAVRAALPQRLEPDQKSLTLRRVFQSLRIAVNEEFTALDSFLSQLPSCLRPGGRVAILSFHSGEDRRVKHALREGLRTSIFSAINDEVIRPSSEEIRSNPRAAPAKLRWAIKA